VTEQWQDRLNGHREDDERYLGRGSSREVRTGSQGDPGEYDESDALDLEASLGYPVEEARHPVAIRPE
jgi:hypothetical protein